MKLFIVLLALFLHASYAQFSDSSSSEVSSSRRPGPRPGPPGPPGPLFPRFLMDLPRFARKEFFDILNNDQLSIDTQNEQLTIWAKAFNVTVRGEPSDSSELLNPFRMSSTSGPNKFSSRSRPSARMCTQSSPTSPTCRLSWSRSSQTPT